jgi:hypothetical protein
VEQHAGALSYNYRYRVNGAPAWNTFSTSVSSEAIGGLAPAQLYEFQVQTVCSTASAFSSSQFFTTQNSSMYDTLISEGTFWKYYDKGTNLGTSWKNTSYIDTSWAYRPAELGYGDGDEATVVSYGPDANNKYITTYFRKSFNVSNPAAYLSVILNIVRDDGAVVYLNGTEVYRSNMPAGTISYGTLASTAIGGADESAWYTSGVNAALLINGMNTLAVEIHQANVTSTDISFNFRLLATRMASVNQGPYLQTVTPYLCHTPVAYQRRYSQPCAVRNFHDGVHHEFL